MSKLSALITLGALAGVGYYVGKKVFDKKKTEKEEQPELFAEERHSTPGEKLQRASLFAVGAIKTGTEKIKEGLDEIVDNDMISKGESTVYDIKSFASGAKDKTVGLAKDAKDKTVSFAKDAKDKTVAFAKDKTSAIKDEIDNLKGIVSSINTGAGEGVDEESSIIDAAADIGDIIEDAAEDIAEAAEEAVSEAAEAAEAVEEAAEDVADEVTDAAEDINDLSFEDGDSVSVDTFDFSSDSDDKL